MPRRTRSSTQTTAIRPPIKRTAPTEETPTLPLTPIEVESLVQGAAATGVLPPDASTRRTVENFRPALGSAAITPAIPAPAAAAGSAAIPTATAAVGSAAIPVRDAIAPAAGSAGSAAIPTAAGSAGSTAIPVRSPTTPAGDAATDPATVSAAALARAAEGTPFELPPLPGPAARASSRTAHPSPVQSRGPRRTRETLRADAVKLPPLPPTRKR